MKTEVLFEKFETSIKNNLKEFEHFSKNFTRNIKDLYDSENNLLKEKMSEYEKGKWSEILKNFQNEKEEILNEVIYLLKIFRMLKLKA